jgi:CBS domain-containing protein
LVRPITADEFPAAITLAERFELRRLARRLTSNAAPECVLFLSRAALLSAGLLSWVPLPDRFSGRRLFARFLKADAARPCYLLEMRTTDLLSLIFERFHRSRLACLLRNLTSIIPRKEEALMKAREVMNTRVTAATPRAIGRDLALQLLSGMYSGLPVVDPKGKVVGVVTEFDLLQAIHEGKDLQTTKAEELMTKPVVCVQEDEEIDAVIGKMTERNIIRLPVVGEDGKLVGVIARSDILSRMIEPEFVTITGH